MKHQTKLDRRIAHYRELSARYKLKPFTGKIPHGVLPIGISIGEFFEYKADRLEDDSLGFILSDAPDAIDLLQFKIDSLNRLASFFKACNRSFKKLGTVSHVRSTPYWDSIIQNNIKGQGKPFPESYFTNLRRRRKFTADRLKALQSAQDFVPFVINGVAVSIENGQIRVKFPGKPDQSTLDALKASPLRLKWSRYQRAWVRKFTGQGDEYFNVLEVLLTKKGVK